MRNNQHIVCLTKPAVKASGKRSWFAILAHLAFVTSQMSFAPVVAHAANSPSRELPVIVAPVRQLSDFADTVEALGTTRANESVDITANVTETVEKIHFSDGQQVKKGDILVTLNKSEEEAELKASQALLDERRAAYQRASELEQKQAMSTAILKEREAVLKQTEGNIEAIKARIADRLIRAPFDGVLGLRNISPGTLVRPGDLITTIDDLDPMKVDFQVPSVFLQSLYAGLPVEGKVLALGNRTFTGRINMISTRADPVTRTLTVRALLPNEGQMLKPGLLMNITLSHNLRPALFIPEEAIIQRDTRAFVLVVTDLGGKIVAKERQIITGRRTPGAIEVVDGLQAEDKVIVHGLMQVKDGDNVSIKAVENADRPLQEMLEAASVGQPDSQ